MNVEWSKDARQDRLDILTYLSSVSLMAAIRVDERIDEALLVLADYPFAGRLGRVDGTRELVISDTRYIAAYRMERGAPVILRLLHASQQWPEAMA